MFRVVIPARYASSRLPGKPLLALKAEIQAAGDRTWVDYNAAVDALSMHENGYRGSRSAWENPQFAREFGAALGYTPNEFNAYSASLNDSNANPFVRQRVLIDSIINEHGLGGNAQVMDWRNRVEPALTRGGDAWVERNNDKVTWGEVLSAIGFVGGALGGFASLAGGPGLFASLGSGVGEAAGAAQGLSGFGEAAGGAFDMAGSAGTGGYLLGSYARDKDGAVACMLMAELAAYVKSEWKTVHQKLDALFWQHGYHAERTINLTMAGSQGMGRMQALKPRDGMTMQEQKEWMAEHQNLMEQMMGQMMAEHHMMMQGMMGKGMSHK